MAIAIPNFQERLARFKVLVTEIQTDMMAAGAPPEDLAKIQGLLDHLEALAIGLPSGTVSLENIEAVVDEIKNFNLWDT